MGASGKDDLKSANGLAVPMGGEPRRMSCSTNEASCAKRRSDCRDFVANHAACSCTASGGAVPTVAAARANHAKKISQTWPNPFAHSVQLRLKRFSRLCVLMNPCPAGLEIHPDLAG